jgi:FkbM family methyltransferase
MSLIKILFVAPHLSTGGAPQYLLKKIQLLKESCDIYCVEYDDITGGVLVVQRKQIQDLLREKLITLASDKGDLVRIINTINPDVVHFEEMPEYFCDHEVARNIYHKDRKYKIVETSHDSSFSPEDKIFYPDSFAFVSDYQKNALSSLGVHSEVVEYPVEYNIKENREKSLLALGLDPNKTHFLNVGLFTSRKNQAEIIDYAKKLIGENVQFHFVGNQADNFKWYWEPLMKDFPSNCKWWGERRDTETFYNAMDVFLFTSKGTNNDKETSPLVLKEAIGWGMPVLMRRLDVYCGMHDKYTNVLYITDDFDSNLLTIKSFIREKKETRLEAWYEESSHKVYYKISNPPDKAKAAKLVLIDSYNRLTNNSCDVSINLSGWVISNAVKQDVNGFSLQIYSDKNELIEEKLVVDFNRSEKLIPKINGSEVIMSHSLRDHSSWWSFCEVFIHKVYGEIKEGDVVVDIGANIGMLSAYALSKNAFKVFSIEPDAKTFSHLQSNLKNFKNITLINKGASGKDEELRFFSSNISSVSSSCNDQNLNLSTLSEEGVEETVIDCLSPKTLFESYGISKIDFLKIDCEGSEFAFFEAIDEHFLKNNISKIFCEVHAFAGTQEDYKTKIKAKLIKCGFEVKEDTNLLLNCNFIFEASKRKKIKIVHLLNDVNSEREKASISSLQQLENFGLLYEQKITPVYKNIPPAENCNRPNQISEAPGEYLLSPGHYGCYLAHRNGIVEGLNDDVDAILLNESDSILQFKPEEMYEKIYEAYDLCIKYDLSYISFGKQIKDYPHKNLENDLYSADSLTEAHCILIPKSKWEYFKNKFETCKWDVSDLWYNIFIKEYSRGIFSRPYALQYPSVSKIDCKFKDGNLLEIENSLLKNFKNEDISVVIQTCDKYEFLWKGWFITFMNNWAWELGWPVYFCSEEKKLPYHNKNIKFINSPISKDASGFSTRTIDILNKVKTKYVLYLQDDMWLDKKVDKQTMLEAFYNVKHFNWNCLKIHNRSWFNYSLSKTNIFANGIRILKQNNDSEYLLSHNASIWNREFLLSVMESNEDPWKNEQLGTERIRNSIQDPRIYHCDYNFYLPYGIARGGAFTEYGEQLIKRLMAQEENKVKYGLE